MGQMGFFDLSKRYTGLDAKNEPLAKIDEVVPWEDFRGCLDAVWRHLEKRRRLFAVVKRSLAFCHN